MFALLGRDVGLALVLGNASSVLVELFGTTGPISKENLASRVRNLLDTKSLILKRSPFLSVKVLTTGLNLYIGAYPIDLPQNISYYWT